ncbi:MAG TPA: nickel pincer cofactor biosynthesis protein LarB [Synergistaceae bacterium]|jgi:NCAIR mutase (PurE)-related protein|nr:nickel pincer cofactor biosynthesis protein LarB [Synergistaceae bacterium]NLL40499.1 nickel pincer cofactor biosynthesis protein LarB [Synergistaceae bacterium]HPX03190.1 nickel pincer cofactor biosynthesis protein LarB [Synergistaceae bacterium]HQA53950.1 nickel pincer cofactor biosynthesis protein LarB [Synergistaceae bacterium]
MEVRLDLDRVKRKGFSEVIFCERKSEKQLREIAEEIINKRLDTAFSRMDERQRSVVASIIEDFEYDAVSRVGITSFGTIEKNGAIVAVVSAGSTDIPVAEEAARIIEFFGSRADRFYDVGVAGIHRLFEVLPEIKKADVVIVAAGMDGALPSVVSGLVSSLVIGLPTSVGYGIAENGMTALRSILCSCSPGLVAVNIDNGVGAALSALAAARVRTGHKD